MAEREDFHVSESPDGNSAGELLTLAEQAPYASAKRRELRVDTVQAAQSLPARQRARIFLQLAKSAYNFPNDEMENSRRFRKMAREAALEQENGEGAEILYNLVNPAAWEASYAAAELRRLGGSACAPEEMKNVIELRQEAVQLREQARQAAAGQPHGAGLNTLLKLAYSTHDPAELEQIAASAPGLPQRERRQLFLALKSMAAEPQDRKRFLEAAHENT